MKNRTKWLLQRAFARIGCEIHGAKFLGSFPMQDMLRLTRLAGRTERPVVFDVGANIGDLIRQFRETLGDPIIHAFEPGPDTFKQLQANIASIPDVTSNNIALGARNEELPFWENDHTDMSSFLEPDKHCWGKVLRQVKVPVRTIDDYCTEKGIDRIDILKSDTQGYDLEVIRGAERMMREGRVHLIYTEITFSDMYKDLPGLDEIYRHLHDRSFRLVTFYRIAYQNDRAGWTNALFTHVNDEAVKEVSRTECPSAYLSNC